MRPTLSARCVESPTRRSRSPSTSATDGAALGARIQPLTIGSRWSRTADGIVRPVFAELPITLADGAVWLSIGQGLLIGAVCLLFGVWVARFVGLLGADAPAGEILGVGLASGLLVLTSWWAAIVSGGRSSFTPVAVGFALAIGLAAVAALAAAHAGRRAGRRRWRRVDDAAPRSPRPSRFRHLVVASSAARCSSPPWRSSTARRWRQSPRDGVQPLEFMDEAYYAVLGADLAKTGTESLYSPSGFTDIPGLPTQTWYHWGEAWLGAIAISLLGTEPLDARHLIVLPLLLLAAAALTGTLVRRMTGIAVARACSCSGSSPACSSPRRRSRSAWSSRSRMYGLAAVAVLLALYALAVLGAKPASWALAAFVGSAAAVILPAHIVIAVLAAVGVGSVWALRIGQSLLARRAGCPSCRPVWRRTWLATGDRPRGHGRLGRPDRPRHRDQRALARDRAVQRVLAGDRGGRLRLLRARCWRSSSPGSWSARRRRSRPACTSAPSPSSSAGTLVWGARLGDFNTFHLFYGALAVFAAPAAAVAIASLWLRLRTTGRRGLAIALVVICGIQLEVGRAVRDRPVAAVRGGRPRPRCRSTILAAIEEPPRRRQAGLRLPAGRGGRLLGRAAPGPRRPHRAARRADVLRVGDVRRDDRDAELDRRRQPAVRCGHPQRALYPAWDSKPSPAAITTFLKANGIDYIYVDKVHPNTLVPDAVPVATDGETQVLRIP